MADKTILDDCRSIVGMSKASDSKKTVAMDCIRTLQDAPDNVTAILPMLLEVYFHPTEEAITNAIAKHAEECSGMRTPSKMNIPIKLLHNIGWPGALCFLAWRIQDICTAIAPLLDK